jgi:hypothetical protein
VTATKGGRERNDQEPPSRSRGKRAYDKPRVTDYGHVTKLTLTGGITTRDTGNMKRRCL